MKKKRRKNEISHLDADLVCVAKVNKVSSLRSRPIVAVALRLAARDKERASRVSLSPRRALEYTVGNRKEFWHLI